MKTKKIFISGTVQGVFFRRFIQDEAHKLKLKGFVRNLNDGRVEIIIEGIDDNVNEMLKKCKEGPPQSDIKDIEINDMQHQGFDSFKVLTI